MFAPPSNVVEKLFVSSDCFSNNVHSSKCVGVAVGVVPTHLLGKAMIKDIMNGICLIHATIIKMHP